MEGEGKSSDSNGTWAVGPPSSVQKEGDLASQAVLQWFWRWQYKDSSCKWLVFSMKEEASISAGS